MPTWFLLALVPPLAWSVANYLDKIVLSRPTGEEGGSGGLLILSSAITLGFALVLGAVIGFPALDAHAKLLLIASGLFEAAYLLCYFLALERESVVTINVLFQFVPVIGLAFGFAVFHELPAPLQLLAVCLILLGTWLVLKKKGEKLETNRRVILLMLGSCTFAVIFNVLFKLAGEGIPFWNAVLWQDLGIATFGAVLFAGVRAYRRQFFSMVTHRGAAIMGITAGAEGMNILALITTNAAILVGPVGLVLSVASVQPIFVLLEAVLLLAVFPKLSGTIEKPTFRWQYVFGILLVCLGGFLIA